MSPQNAENCAKRCGIVSLIAGIEVTEKDITEVHVMTRMVTRAAQCPFGEGKLPPLRDKISRPISPTLHAADS